MKQPLVSILICTYNAEKTIKQTLDTCINQTYKDVEILIHDDQSKDKTIDIIKNIGDKRIKILDSGKKLGPYKGLNFLLEHAKGKYIAIQDHDDLWYLTKIEKQLKFLEENNNYVGCGTKTMIRYEGDNMGYEYYLGDSCFFTIHPSLVFRNLGFRYNGDRVYMGDAYFQKKILCNGEKKIGNIDEVLTIHRVKKGADNYTYKWFKLSILNLKTLYYIYPPVGGSFVIIFELMRKIIYPFLHYFKIGKCIDKIERLPFLLRGFMVKKFIPGDF